MYDSFIDHPIVNLLNYDFNISLNTDNRLMSNTNIKKEIDICKNIGITNPEDLLVKSASYSFLN
jgi:adenosine deaminase